MKIRDDGDDISNKVVHKYSADVKQQWNSS